MSKATRFGLPRLDDSHQPFKRKRSLGPGPRRRPRVAETKNWECEKRPSTWTHYIQVCRYVGDNAEMRGTKRTVKTSKKTKRVYNKEYRAWLKRHEGKVNKPQSSYSCRPHAGTRCK